MTYLLFAVALSLSAVAAYYAVMGLIAIFAASVIPIAIMGSLLEAAKLTVASWLYRSWGEIPKLMKVYFTVALIVLMLLTSMGIFGFLSKAHLDQAVPTGDVSAKLALLDEKIKTEKENINASRKELSQLDAQVDQTIGRTTEASGAERAIAIRRGQQKDRARILNEIGQAQAKIAKYNEERAPIASEVRKVEAEVGPIKYIAALIYGDNPETDVLEKAVRWVIIMIVIVFDPLAVLLLIAANWQLRKETEDKNEYMPNLSSETTKPSNEIVGFYDDVKLEEAVNVSVKPDAWVADVGEKPTAEEKLEIQQSNDAEIPEITVDEPSAENKDWEPELYKRLHVVDPAHPITQSFLNKVKSFLSTEKTIEREVEDLQNKNPK